MALWTPSEITTDLWLDASDASTITIATGVSQWADKSGNNRHATQATTTNRPAVAPGAVNGLNAINFDGTNDVLRLAASIFSSKTSYSVFLVCKNDDAGAGARIAFGERIAGNGAGVFMAKIDNTSIIYRRGGITASTNADITESAGFPTTPQLLEMVTSASSGQAFRNGNSVGTNASTISTFTLNPLAIGANLTDSNGVQQFWDGYICEFIVIFSALSTNDRQQIEGYLSWRWGLQAGLPVDHPYKSAAPTIPNITSVRAILDQPYSLIGGLVRSILDQTYHITNRQVAVLIQVYSLRMLAVLAQHYGNVPVVRAYLEQYYGSADLLRRLLSQLFGDALQLRQSLVESWNLPGDLLAIMEMRYFISEGDLRVLMSYNYDLSEYTLLRQKLEQIFIAGPDAEEAQEPLFSATTDIGDSLNPHHINIEIDEGEYAIKGEIHLADQNEFLLCKHIETEIIIPIDSTEYHLLVEGPRQSRPEGGRVEYYIPLASKTILLDSPYATPIDQEFTGALASVIVAGLAAIKSITVVWQLIDWYIPTGVLTANNESPLSIIRRIVNAVGGILQSSPAGELICLPEYPISTTEWETATPDFYLTDMDNFFSVDSTSDIREGYNRFLISDKVIDESGLTLEQVDIDENTKDIYVYQVPWNPLEQVILHTSGGAWVSIVAEGITTEKITEIVEIIAGEGMTQKPFYGKISHDYKETELGLITINEDKTVSTDLSQNSLVEVVYNTKYWKFRVRDAEIEKVQFFPEAIAI